MTVSFNILSIFFSGKSVVSEEKKMSDLSTFDSVGIFGEIYTFIYILKLYNKIN